VAPGYLRWKTPRFIRTIVPNPGGILMPGQFANFVFPSTRRPDRLSRKRLWNHDGRFVDVLNDDHKVHQPRRTRLITLFL
jgi:hypothetical protein